MTLPGLLTLYRALYRALGLALILGAALPALAETPPAQSHEAIRTAVREFLLAREISPGAEMEVWVNDLDPRLRLAACERPLEVFLPPSAPPAGRVTAGVRCTGASRWSLYVPARVRWLDEVVVAARELTRGSRIDAASLSLERRDLARLPRGYFLTAGEAAGLVPDRTVARGTVLHPGLLDTPLAVRRGGLVNIVARVAGAEIRMKGKALDAGAMGARIRVENLSSGRELEARVVSAATVRVDI
jgi:flagella basal body P-ring formation protein FlgA